MRAKSIDKLRYTPSWITKGSFSGFYRRQWSKKPQISKGILLAYRFYPKQHLKEQIRKDVFLFCRRYTTTTTTTIIIYNIYNKSFTYLPLLIYLPLVIYEKSFDFFKREKYFVVAKLKNPNVSSVSNYLFFKIDFSVIPMPKVCLYLSTFTYLLISNNGTNKARYEEKDFEIFN